MSKSDNKKGSTANAIKKADTHVSAHPGSGVEDPSKQLKFPYWEELIKKT